MEFKKWLISETSRTGAKLGLYPDLADNLGQLPPLACTAASSDFVTYYDMMYGKKPLKFLAPGIVDAEDMKRVEKINKKINKIKKQIKI